MAGVARPGRVCKGAEGIAGSARQCMGRANRASLFSLSFDKPCIVLGYQGFFFHAYAQGDLFHARSSV
ncbi:MAG: hypothetical protein LBB80_08870 [Treponema sp.]|nr:hypothetical protein [Treponema sp.]